MLLADSQFKEPRKFVHHATWIRPEPQLGVSLTERRETRLDGASIWWPARDKVSLVCGSHTLSLTSLRVS